VVVLDLGDEVESDRPYSGVTTEKFANPFGLRRSSCDRLHLLVAESEHLGDGRDRQPLLAK